MYSDDPILSSAQDEVGVSGLVERLARAILEWPEDRGLVVGLYGQWGQGKTSTLNLLERALFQGDGKRRGLVVRFNPWYCSSESTMLLSFFGTLARGIGTSDLLGPIAKRRLGSLFKGVGKVAGSLGSTITGGAVPATSIDAALNVVSDILADGQLELERRRDKLATKLQKLGHQSPALRAVVLIDDLDRVSDAEIALVLKLVRLVASLPNVTYVVAADDHRVRQAISREVTGEYGVSFLEKIVQVAVHLPPLSPSRLESLMKEGLAKVVEEGKIGSADDVFTPEKYRNLDFFPETIGRRVRTLRDRARLLNTLRFLLLSGQTRLEVHPHDVMLIAFLQTFYPDVYRRVARNRVFLTGDSPLEVRLAQDLAGRSREAEMVKAREETFFQIESGVRNRDNAAQLMQALDAAGMTEDDLTTVANVVELLFPNAKHGFSYDDEAHRQERLENRIRHPDRFDRYFTLEPPSTEVSDESVEQFLQELKIALKVEEDARATVLLGLFDTIPALPSDGHRESFMTKFRDRLAQQPLTDVVGIAEAVLGAQKVLGDATPSLVYQLVRRAAARRGGEDPDSERIALSIAVREVQLLSDLGDAITAAKAYVMDKIPGVHFEDAEKREIARAGIARMAEAIKAGENVFDGKAPVDAMVVLWRWRDLLEWLKEDTLPIQVYMRKLLAKEPAALIKLLHGLSAAGPDGRPRFAMGNTQADVTASLDQVVGTDHILTLSKTALERTDGPTFDEEAIDLLRQAVAFLSPNPGPDTGAPS